MKDIQQTHHNYVNFWKSIRILAMLVCVVVFVFLLLAIKFEQFSPQDSIYHNNFIKKIIMIIIIINKFNPVDGTNGNCPFLLYWFSHL